MNNYGFKIENNHLPKYIQIKNQLKEYMKNGKVKVGDLFFSDPQVAKMFGVTTKTARQAFQELRDEKLIYSVHGKGTFIADQYIPEERTKNILIFACRDIKFCYSNLVSEDIGGMQMAAEKYGYRFQFHEANAKHEVPKSIVDKSVDGVILLSGDRQSEVKEILKTKIPFVTLNKILNEVPSVSFDEFKAGYLATEHLIKDCGCRKILHLTSGNWAQFAEERLAGYKAALKNNNIKFNKDLILDGDCYFPVAEKVITNFLKANGKCFDAIFAANDEMALAALKVLQQNNIKIPEDVKIIGCDNERSSEMSNPALTTIHLDRYKMGQTGFELLMNIIEGKEDVKSMKLDVKLIKRKTT